MKNGKIEKEDADRLRAIYNKFNVHGIQTKPLTMDEQVLIFSLANWIENLPVKCDEVAFSYRELARLNTMIGIA